MTDRRQCTATSTRSGPHSRAVGQALRQTRRWQDHSQEEIAEAMRQLGHPTWSRATVSEIERGGRAVTVDELAGLAATLGVDPLSLLVGPIDRSHP